SVKIPFFVDQFDSKISYEKTIDIKASLTGEVILSQNPVFLTEEMLITRSQQKRIVGTTPKQWIGVPLIVQKKVIGIMAIQSYDNPQYFTLADQDILVAVSNQVGIAIERKQNLDEIALLQNYLFNIINSMPSILVGVNKRQQVTQWNLQAQMETGIRVEEAVGKDVIKVLPRLLRNLDQIVESIASKKVKTSLKNSFQRKGDIRYEDIIIYPLITNGVDGAVIRMDDITDQVLLEEMMIQSEKMLSIGGLAAGMAHEINNPLAGMMQNTQVVYQRLSAKIPANIKIAEELGLNMESIKEYMSRRGILETLEMINKTGSRAANIITNMLSFARKSDTILNAHDLASLLLNTVELAKSDYNLKKQYDFKKICIETEFDQDMPKVLCDKNKIQQVFLNLLKNGAHAMHGDSNNHKESRFILRLKKETNMARIEIEDNGPGMNENIQKRLFEPFFTTKAVGKGTGLGLSVSYFIIANDHKGKMHVESTLGKSTTFIIQLPLSE
ncbi:MAG: GAF domain-containing protein, partial [Desulfobacteraceae bacterium]|nr:GAF domain-containing protein [Desulfobacteraceae bacterium]